MEAKSLSAKSFGPESSLQLVQWSIAVVYLMKAILGFAILVAVPGY